MALSQEGQCIYLIPFLIRVKKHISS